MRDIRLCCELVIEVLPLEMPPVDRNHDGKGIQLDEVLALESLVESQICCEPAQATDA
jgi:hypothetical protein